ncbi:NADH-quinone oxidoreductase subunit C [Fulvivirga sedimenti]|nr:NADH-quinone oxidoreductase subunit C [Fulvivirga sedimenti]
MKEVIEELLSGREYSWIPENSPAAIIVELKDLRFFMESLYSHKALFFDVLSCVTGIDNGPEEGTMEVVYNLCSIPHERSLMVHVFCDREKPVVPTMSDIWRTADWLERETYDLLGIQFEHHPDQRRILLPADWEGFPLRKDYKEQEYYHGIRVAY